MGFPRRIARGLAGLRLGVGNTARNNVFGADDLPIPVAVTAWYDSELHIPCARHGPPLGVRGDQTLLRAAAGRTEMRLPPPSRYPLHARIFGGWAFSSSLGRLFWNSNPARLHALALTGAASLLPDGGWGSTSIRQRKRISGKPCGLAGETWLGTRLASFGPSSFT